MTPAQFQNLFRLGLLQTDTELGNGVAPVSWEESQRRPDRDD